MSNYNPVPKMIPEKIMRLMEDTKKDAKAAAFAFFNKCDLTDLQKDKICKVETERVESFLKYANEKGIHPCGGAITNDLKAQYFYV